MSEKVFGAVKKRKLKIQSERGELVSESGGQIVPATSLVAMTSQLIFLFSLLPPLHRRSSVTER